jgi:NADH-quinone oxidoreductase subunit M
MADLLNLMIFLPALAAMACLIAPTRQQARWIALLASIATLLLCIILTIGFDRTQTGPQFVTNIPWIPMLSACYHTGVDGLSLPMALLTTGLSVLVVLASWRIDKATHVFMACSCSW